MKASSWVLSPISANATRPVEIRKASNESPCGRADADDHVLPRPNRKHVVKGLARSGTAGAMARVTQAKYVDASPSRCDAEGGYSPMTRRILPARGFPLDELRLDHHHRRLALARDEPVQLGDHR